MARFINSNQDTADVLESFDFDSFLEADEEIRPETIQPPPGSRSNMCPRYPQPPGTQQGAADRSTGSQPEFHTSMTISDDRSRGEDQDRYLLALKDRDVGNQPPTPAGPGQFTHSNPAPNPYPGLQYSTGPPYGSMQKQPLLPHQQQLMMLEQQNKARLLAARQEQASKVGNHPPQGSSDHALQDYQMQMMLLEQQNKKRLLSARQELDLQDQKRPRIAQHADLPPFPKESEQEAVLETSTRVPHAQYSTADAASMEQSLLNLLSGNASNADVINLKQKVELLQARVQQLEAPSEIKTPSRYQVLYRIYDDDSAGGNTCTYLDHPRWVRDDKQRSVLRADLRLDNLDLFLERNKDISFVVYQDFDTDMDVSETSEHDAALTYQGIQAQPKPTDEFVRPVSKDLSTAITSIVVHRREFRSLRIPSGDGVEFKAPYLFIYHSRSELEHLRSRLPSSANDQLALFLNYVQNNYGSAYATADELLKRGQIIPEYMQYLFSPNDILISRRDNDILHGHALSDWPHHSCKVEHTSNDKDTPTGHSGKDQVLKHFWNFRTWQWKFDGTFSKRDDTLSLTLLADTKNEKSIADLDVYPLCFASEETVSQLRRRGQTFWKCCNRRLVTYTEKDNSQERYMVDLKTYYRLHSIESIGQMIPRHNQRLDQKAMDQDQPPDDRFEFLVPSEIKAFNLRRKKWFDLSVDRISDVVWNRSAFHNLVFDDKTKDLIHALVSKQLAAERSTDLIAGKGNGLIMLLHGGPGTGKTLTAESVAEIAEKPLFRVTCGDVGTKPEEVEKYLESVLHLGKIWGCVVLLDEADVFLEQRSLRDLDRNALVSVFLRVLEYYEGILFLTSNRVGTFDEAFRSRIQLALHYPALGPYQRLRIWENFFGRLEGFASSASSTDATPVSPLKEERAPSEDVMADVNDDDDDDDKVSVISKSSVALVDVADLRAHLLELRDEKMNGRQIRNAITTARQYAEWKGQVLTYALLKDVIDVAGRFDLYLDRLNGLRGDEVAAEEGLRVVEEDV